MNEEQCRQIQELYLEMQPKLLSYARVRLNSMDQAEEAIQETFRIACGKPEQLLESGNPPGWLMNTLKYVILDTMRQQESGRQLLSKYLLAMSTAITFTEDKISLDVLYENIADREEFTLIKEMAVDGRSHQEMAAARGISVDACKKRVQRAKETLKSKLKL
ncbi:MAG: sigma-70 family RNA polymerase sigma factor [Oscillospiraceae bacterium]|nr:sigma-70 family RNA polymerase sigma factor [Oscillospiraceae bacterium]